MPKSIQALNGNTLKIIALLIMTADHIGMIIFPGVRVLRIIGRLAMPIFAFMIAEGCYYTHNKPRYFLRVFVVGAVFQLLLFIFRRSLYQFILITFSISILLIYMLQKMNDVYAQKRNAAGKMLWTCGTVFAVAAAAFICTGLPSLFPETDLAIDYGIFGVLLPVFVYIPNFFANRESELFRPFQLLFEAAGILLLTAVFGRIEAWALLSLILLFLYNGKRGKLNIKYFFYLYFPLHLGLLYFIEAFML